ncbi:MAG TPA: GNAT family N-acetyltransferase [Thermoanaerobaculia bacterium]|jgi:dTDP-4-amino-4,6-dideoxy-D-galactose acyltransferase|nr:GNAT family N-acetyltransferase [Thermoanaerobaculia bacterium]
MTGSEEVCRYLPWDSEFFGVRIGSVLPRQLNAAAVAAIHAFRQEHRIDCLYFLAALEDAATIRLAEDEGFRMVDIRVTLERRGAPPLPSKLADGVRIRTAEERDLPILQALAQENHVDTRFYYDGHFSRERCDALYATWIENGVRGQADRVLVPEVDGRAAGYITCHREGPPRIGLLGVGPAAQGKGLGGRLVREALAWFAGEGIERVSVVTQGRNVRAQRAYQRQGFTTMAVEVWYHGWTQKKT